jgi:hypothetical protein
MAQLRYFSIFEAANSQQSVIIIVAAVVKATAASYSSCLIDEAPRLVKSCDAIE